MPSEYQASNSFLEDVMSAIDRAGLGGNAGPAAYARAAVNMDGLQGPFVDAVGYVPTEAKAPTLTAA